MLLRIITGMIAGGATWPGQWACSVGHCRLPEPDNVPVSPASVHGGAKVVAIRQQDCMGYNYS